MVLINFVFCAISMDGTPSLKILQKPNTFTKNISLFHWSAGYDLVIPFTVLAADGATATWGENDSGCAGVTIVLSFSLCGSKLKASLFPPCWCSPLGFAWSPDVLHPLVQSLKEFKLKHETQRP